ncbi:MAG TPA: hypothetical protein VGV57_12870 [Thermoleophilaceae bacterium]|nr:hypothetical protein [Thermoleophilaceae bacterium]
MLERLTSETFADHVGDAFEATPVEGEPLQLLLSRCEETPYGSAEGLKNSLRRVPFSLVFHAPRDRLLPQQTWSLRHPAVGEFALFLVPLGPDENGMRYEAVIS